MDENITTYVDILIKPLQRLAIRFKVQKYKPKPVLFVFKYLIAYLFYSWHTVCKHVLSTTHYVVGITELTDVKEYKTT